MPNNFRSVRVSPPMDTLHDFFIHQALMEAKSWSVSIGGKTRTLRKLFGMVTWGLCRTIKAAADTFDDRDIAQGFVTTL